MKRHEIINKCIQRFNYTSYLEIGLDEGNERNDEKIEAKEIVSVDPAPGSRATFNMTSDDFFKQNKRKFDIIFIDGLHTAEQVMRDIVNSAQALNPNGTIIMHDCNPTTEAMQRVPRIQGEWTGDVWKAFVRLRRNPRIKMFVVETDYGVGILRDGEVEALTVPEEQLTYENFAKNKKSWLNLTPVEMLDETLI